MFESKPMILQKSQWQYLLCILVFFIYCKRGATNLCHFLCWKKCYVFLFRTKSYLLQQNAGLVQQNARSLTTLARTWDLSSMGAFAERISEVKQLTAHYRHCKLCSNNGFVPICLFLWRRPSYESYILCTMFTLESTKRKRWEPWTVVLKLNQPRWQAT